MHWMIWSKSEYDQEIPQSQITDKPRTPRGRDTEHRQPHDSKITIKEKQPGLSSSARWLICQK